jgi:hypothetical protein
MITINSMTQEEITAKYKDKSKPFNGLRAFIEDWANGDMEALKGLQHGEYASFQIYREEEYTIFAIFQLFDTDDLEWEESLKPSIHDIVDYATRMIADEIIADMDDEEAIQTARKEESA